MRAAVHVGVEPKAKGAETALGWRLYEGPNRMPVGFQVSGPQNEDDRTIAFAAWIDTRLREA